MAKYQILYWHDIPVQVKSRDRSGRASRELATRFQAAIDSAAMMAGLTESDDYIEAFQWSKPQERAGTAQKVVEMVVAELEAQYPKIDWQKTVEKIQHDPSA